MRVIKRFNRFELKYIIPYSKIGKLKEYILKYANYDPYGNADGKYTLASLYYDSPDYRFYHEKINGLRYRKKLRLRWYETAEGLNEDSIVYAEIKQRVDRVTQKRRVPMKYKEALVFLNEGIIPHHKEEDAEVIDEIYTMLKLYKLRPTAITTYVRQAFIGTDYDMGLRITFDSHVTYRLKDLGLGAGTYDGFIVPPGYAIMEIKTDERIPHWITELVAVNELQLIRISKYCTGLEQSKIII